MHEVPPLTVRVDVPRSGLENMRRDAELLGRPVSREELATALAEGFRETLEPAGLDGVTA